MHLAVRNHWNSSWEERKKIICTQALRFLVHPKKLELNNEELWVQVDNNPTLILHQLIDWEFKNLNQDLPPIQIMSNNASDPHFFELIGELFKTMSKIKIGLWGSLGSILFVVLILAPLDCFCVCPGCLRKIVPNFCSECFLKQIDGQIFTNQEVELGQNETVQTPSATNFETQTEQRNNQLPVSPDIEVVRQLMQSFQMEPITTG